MKKIINFLDDYLLKNSQNSINAVEANAILAKAGILKDNENRRGKPLRDLLRLGRLPHAYQSGGKGSSWIIPHSNMRKESLSNYLIKPQLNTNGNNVAQITDVFDRVGTQDLRIQYEKFRLRYKPDKIKYLLIAEAPPNNLDRFFYYEEVHNHDYLFLGVVQALYPELKEKFLASGRNSEIKKTILLKLKADGFYLLDLSELPLSLITGGLDAQLPSLLSSINQVIDDKTNIILIKATVYDAAFLYLRERGFNNTVDVRIPFPAQGGQKEFQKKFCEALKLINSKF